MIVATVVYIVHSVTPKTDEAAEEGRWQEHAEHHVHEQNMGPGDVFWYLVPYKDFHRMRIAVEADGGVTVGIMETGTEESLKSDSGWFLDHIDRATCVHANVSNATFDCQTQPPLLLVVGDARPGNSESRDRIHVKVDAYDCTAGCRPLPQQ